MYVLATPITTVNLSQISPRAGRLVGVHDYEQWAVSIFDRWLNLNCDMGA
jgi:hypothetical protein